ncbi:hypothetical protein DRH27_01435 [Candidatus Falkowbacteria bacterium]|nr:MAG: hypothetical protein DRH27_01435 [Candidatus Falkowbacteria bacterium]
MGIFDTIVGSITGGKKIYKSQIQDVPGSRFYRSVRLNVKDKVEQLEGEELRDLLAGMVAGGISLTNMEKKLKKAGLEGAQYERRKEILNILKEIK